MISYCKGQVTKIVATYPGCTELEVRTPTGERRAINYDLFTGVVQPGAEAVSYTHLDVYKRQVFDQAIVHHQLPLCHLQPGRNALLAHEGAKLPDVGLFFRTAPTIGHEQKEKKHHQAEAQPGQIFLCYPAFKH